MGKLQLRFAKTLLIKWKNFSYRRFNNAGGTAEAAAKLIEISGGSVAGFIFVINLYDLPGIVFSKKNLILLKVWSNFLVIKFLSLSKFQG